MPPLKIIEEAAFNYYVEAGHYNDQGSVVTQAEFNDVADN
jgi:hypothetical protein